MQLPERIFEGDFVRTIDSVMEKIIKQRDNASLTEDEVLDVYIALGVFRSEYSLYESPEDFVEKQLDKYYGKYKLDENVLKFIAGIICKYRYGYACRQDLFTNGYCLYFARTLKDLFNRGTVCMTYPTGHVIWEDVGGTCYDVNGVYDLAEYHKEFIIPFDKYPRELTDGYWHVNTHEEHLKPTELDIVKVSHELRKSLDIDVRKQYSLTSMCDCESKLSGDAEISSTIDRSILNFICEFRDSCVSEGIITKTFSK